MSIMKIKYPRTPHLPWSPGKDKDDVTLSDTSMFVGKEVVVTEKLDGECTTLYRDGLHARSLDGKFQPWQSWLRAFHADVGRFIPGGMRICGEYLYARHSIEYTRLDSYFYVFGLYDFQYSVPWETVEEWCRVFQLKHVPVLYRGIWDEKKVKACWGNGVSHYGAELEGYVVRLTSYFHYNDFSKSVAKYVRKNHVKTDEHWTRNWVPNKVLIK